jgi:DNA-binding beta-propeller fold protein YncE
MSPRNEAPRRLRPAAVAAIVATAVSLGIATNASAVGQIEYGGCVSADGSGGKCGVASSAMAGANSVAVSPDGKSIYVSANSGNAVSVFDRAPAGQITYAGCVSDDGTGGKCAPLPGRLGNLRDVVVSPDGKNFYVTALASNAVVAFDRAPHGQITFAGCVSEDGSGGKCTPAKHPLYHPQGLAISPDGHSLYIAIDGGVAVLNHSSSGALEYAGCTTADGSGVKCTDGPDQPLLGATGVAVSPDGKSLYVSATTANAVSVFDRVAGGGITYAGCVASTALGGACADLPGEPVNGAISLTVSPDGRSLYVPTNGEIAVLDRVTTGQLTWAGCVSSTGSGGACAELPGSRLAHATHAAVSGDGENVYVSSLDGFVTAFIREPFGQITYLTCFSNDGSGPCYEADDSLRAANWIAISPDDGSLYVASMLPGKVAHFFRKARPDTRIVGGPAEGSATRDGTPTFRFASDQAGAAFVCKIDGGRFDPCEPVSTLGPLADGRHRLTVKAKTKGDDDLTPATRSFRVDTTGPQVRITRAPRSKLPVRGRSVRVRFAFVANEAGARFRCSLDGGAFVSCKSPARVRVRRGRHRFVVQALDALGNAGKPATRSFRVTRR